MSAPRSCECAVCVADRRLVGGLDYPELSEVGDEGREATPPPPPFAGEDTADGLGEPAPVSVAASFEVAPPAPPSCSWGPVLFAGWWWAVSGGALVWWLRSGSWVRSGETLQEQVWRLAWASRGSP